MSWRPHGCGARRPSPPARHRRDRHWGYLGRTLKPRVEIASGDYVTIETLTHHANDDAERMVTGDPGIEGVFLRTRDRKGVAGRGAGPEDAKLGPGGGLGVPIRTGPVAIRGAEPGDLLEVRLLDVAPRPSANPKFKGSTFGSNAAAWWGYHHDDMLEGKKREIITISEVDADSGSPRWWTAAGASTPPSRRRSFRKGRPDRPHGAARARSATAAIT